MKTNPLDHDITTEFEALREQFSGVNAVDWVAQQGIEIENPEFLSAQIDALINEFGIEDEAFRSGRDKLLITAIAHDLGEQPLGQNKAKSDRAADMIALTFGDKSRLKDAVKEAEYAPGFSERRTFEAYEVLNHQERSEELATYIENDEAFALVRERLGITPETQVPFTVRVLNIGDDLAQYGWQPDIDWDNLSYEEAAEQDNTRHDQAEALKQNQHYLVHESGYSEEDAFPPVWVYYAEDGSKTLCIPLPTAEKVLYPDAERAFYYDHDRDYAADKAYLLHEFTHTQKPILRSHSIGLGVGLEELRAEHFSGDKHGYIDIKRYYRSMQVLYDYSPKSSLESQGSFDPEAFELEMAQMVGLEGYLDAMTLIPNRYTEGSAVSPFLKELVNVDGGVDGHFDRMYDRAIETLGEEEVARRISAFVDTIVEFHKSTDPPVVTAEGVLSYQWPKNFTNRAITDYRARYGSEEEL
jgi:hypothetical protein